MSRSQLLKETPHAAEHLVTELVSDHLFRLGDLECAQLATKDVYISHTGEKFSLSEVLETLGIAIQGSHEILSWNSRSLTLDEVEVLSIIRIHLFVAFKRSGYGLR